MRVSVTWNGDAVDVALDDELTASNRHELKQVLLDITERGARRVRLDLAACPMIDSSGLGLLVSMQKRMHSRQCEFALMHVCEEIRVVLSLTKLDTLFTIHPREATDDGAREGAPDWLSEPPTDFSSEWRPGD